MEDLTIVTCNCDTPDLIINLKRSIEKHCSVLPKILVMDTGESSMMGIQNIKMLNTSHGNAVNAAFDLVKTRYMLLVDSDVLFLKDIKQPYEKFKEGGFVLMGEVVGDRGGKSLYPRVNPWFCFIDLEQLKEHNINFYDHHRTKEMKSERIYDIGSTMFEDVINAELTVANAKMENKYFKHYEGMSWRVQKYNPDNGDTDIDIGGTHDNIQLYKLGLYIREQYNKDVANL
jgi:hypothetical protein